MQSLDTSTPDFYEVNMSITPPKTKKEESETIPWSLPVKAMIQIMPRWDFRSGILGKWTLS